jgi:hypothetical protein
VHKTIFLLGAGFTKAAQPSSPTNAEVIPTLVDQLGESSWVQKYRTLYCTDDIEVLLTRLDIDAASDASKRSDRLAIEGELVSYFRRFRFTAAALNAAPWLSSFATELLGQGDAIITLNYDCFLEGLLDHYAVWTPNGGYDSVDNILVEAEPNPKEIVIYKIHGSEHFRISGFFDRPEQEAIAYEFDESIFPVSAAHSHFGGGIDSRPYVIAPSFVKLPHLQIATMMLKILDFASLARNLVIIGCGLRREDNFLWLLLTRFLRRPDEKCLVIVDPAATSISERLYRYWIGDPSRYARVSLLPGSLESSFAELITQLRER